MKIQQDLQKQLDTSRKKKQTVAPEKHSFHHLVQSQTRLLEQAGIKQKMDDITHQGDRLARMRTFGELVKFKRLVKVFMREVIGGGFDLAQSHSFQLDGGSRQLMLVKIVDGKLVELTEEIMHEEQRTVDLLGIIGEIKGLLVDLAF